MSRAALVLFAVSFVGWACRSKSGDGQQPAPDPAAEIEAIAEKGCACTDNACALAVLDELQPAKDRFSDVPWKGGGTKERELARKRAYGRVALAEMELRKCLVQFPLDRVDEPVPTVEQVCTHMMQDAKEPGLRATLMTQCLGVSRWRKTQAPDKWPACARCTMKAAKDSDHRACDEHCLAIDDSVAAAILDDAIAAGVAAKQAAGGEQPDASASSN